MFPQNTADLLDREEFGSSVIEIWELKQLAGSIDSESAEKMFYLKQSGVKLRLIRIILNGREILTTESGALYYLKGQINKRVEIGGTSGVVKKVIGNKMTGESVFKPEYSGRGEVVLEPSFHHFKIINLKNDSFIVNKGIYYCSLGDIKISAASTGSISASVMGGDGLIQTRVSGTGLVVLNIPVPMNEIISYRLNNEELQVDGNFFILRSSNLKYTIQPSSNSMLGTIVSNEGLLATIKGSGIVWLAPTAPIYESLKWGEVGEIQAHGMHNTYDKSRPIR